GHPLAQLLLREFKDAEIENQTTVAVRFVENRGRDAPLFVAVLPIFSRAYYSSHAFDETTLEAPLGSGPYKVGRFEAGRFIEYEGGKNWWGSELACPRGHNHFRVIRFEF